MLLGVTGSIAAYKAGLARTAPGRRGRRRPRDPDALRRAVRRRRHVRGAHRQSGPDVALGHPRRGRARPSRARHRRRRRRSRHGQRHREARHRDRRRPAHVDAARDDQPADPGARHAHRHVAAPRDGRERRDARRARVPCSSVRSSGRWPPATKGSAASPSPRTSSERSSARSRVDSDLDGTRIVVTAGPTHEPIDPVRFIGNRSTREDGRRGRRGGVVAGRGRPPDPRSGHGRRAAGGDAPSTSRPPRRCIAPSCRRPTTRTSS